MLILRQPFPHLFPNIPQSTGPQFFLNLIFSLLFFLKSFFPYLLKYIICLTSHMQPFLLHLMRSLLRHKDSVPVKKNEGHANTVYFRSSIFLNGNYDRWLFEYLSFFCSIYFCNIFITKRFYSQKFIKWYTQKEFEYFFR